MTWLRALAFNIAFIAYTVVLGILALPTLVAGGPYVLRLLRFWARGVLLLLRWIVGLRFEVTGLEHLPRQGPALVAAQHQSAFDTVVWFLLLPDCVYVLKRELLNIPIYGWYARRGGMIAVDRSAGASAMRGLLRDGQAALEARRQVVIFPEGTRVAPGVEAPYQPGIAALYARAKLPVVPAATNSGRFWGRRAFTKHKGTITIALGPPIPPGATREVFLATLRARIDAASEDFQSGLASPTRPVDKSGESDS
jgi:1-acyl-sn-glycerol-3-phosphate acyltransferase